MTAPLLLHKDPAPAGISYMGVACLQSRLPTALDFLKQHCLLFDAFAVYDLKGLLSLDWSLDRQQVLHGLSPELRDIVEELTPQLDYLWWNGLLIDGQTQMWQLTEQLDADAKSTFEGDRQEALRLREELAADIKREASRKVRPHPGIEDARSRLATTEDPKGNLRAFVLGSDALYRIRETARLSQVPEQHMWNSLNTRLCAGVVTAATQWSATSLEDIPRVGRGGQRTAKSADLYSIILKKIPAPSPMVPWEDIVAFKQEAEQKRHLADLRAWITAVSKEKITFQEAHERIEVLLSDYDMWMKASGMRYGSVTLNTIVQSLLDLATLSPKKAIGRLFDIRKEKAQLLEGELKAPGRSLAYVVKARTRYAPRPA